MPICSFPVRVTIARIERTWRQSGGVDVEGAVEELEHRLATAHATVHVVAVDGHSAAGKSTFASELVGRLGAARIPGDDFYRAMDPDARAALNAQQGAALYDDWERMLNEAVTPLRHSQPARYRPYDWSRNRLSERTHTIRPASVVVVEGLFVSRPELDHVIDTHVLVAAEPSIRHQRQIDRANATQDWLDRWDAAERWYFEHVRHVDSFDLWRWMRMALGTTGVVTGWSGFAHAKVRATAEHSLRRFTAAHPEYSLPTSAEGEEH